MPWYHEVDLSKKIAIIINTLHKKESLKKVIKKGEDDIALKVSKK